MPALSALAAIGSLTPSSTALPTDDATRAAEVEFVIPEEASNDLALLAGSNCTYYADALHTIVVGQFGYDCCNNAVHWGKKSAFKVCGGCFPCFPPPP